MNNYILVAVGGSLGSSLRFFIREILPCNASTFPWATVLVNWIGCLLVGLLASFLPVQGEHHMLKLFLGIGFLGGFTTFSAFGLETVSLIEQGEIFLALSYSSVTVIGGLLLVYLGQYCVR